MKLAVWFWLKLLNVTFCGLKVSPASEGAELRTEKFFHRDAPRWRLELYVEDASLHWHLDAVGTTIAGRPRPENRPCTFMHSPVPRNAGSVPGQPVSTLMLLYTQRVVYPITDLRPVAPLNPISSLASRNARICPRLNPSAACMLTINSQHARPGLLHAHLV